MASSTNGTGNNLDELRYRNYVTQMERDQDATIKDKEDRHQERLASLGNLQTDKVTELRKDYDVKISQEAESLDKKLSLIRERNQILSNEARENGEREADKVHTQYMQRIESEKRTGDEQLARLQNYYKRASDELHHQFEKERVRNAQKGSAT